MAVSCVVIGTKSVTLNATTGIVSTRMMLRHEMSPSAIRIAKSEPAWEEARAAAPAIGRCAGPIPVGGAP